MDVIIAFKKYLKNYRIIFLTSILFLFLLFLIDPLISIFGGSLNISYNISNIDLGTGILTSIIFLIFIFMFSLIQTIIIHKIGSEYEFNGQTTIKKTKESFIELIKFNIIFILLIYLISSFLYNLSLLNNIIVDIIFFIITIAFWFTPQIIIMENEYVGKAMLISLIYLKNNWLNTIKLIITSFILIFISFSIDVIFGNIIGSILSIIFFVLFIIPFIEILKTEVYLDKYKLLKPM